VLLTRQVCYPHFGFAREQVCSKSKWHSNCRNWFLKELFGYRGIIPQILCKFIWISDIIRECESFFVNYRFKPPKQYSETCKSAVFLKLFCVVECAPAKRDLPVEFSSLMSNATKIPKDTCCLEVRGKSISCPFQSGFTVLHSFVIVSKTV
jgi:hypothetical protein